jgi:hypothetical protein
VGKWLGVELLLTTQKMEEVRLRYTQKKKIFFF